MNGLDINTVFLIITIVLAIAMLVQKIKYKAKIAKANEKEKQLLSINESLVIERKQAESKVKLLKKYLEVKGVKNDYDIIEADILTLDKSIDLNSDSLTESIKVFIDINKDKNLSAKDFITTIHKRNSLPDKVITKIMNIYVGKQENTVDDVKE